MLKRSKSKMFLDPGRSNKVLGRVRDGNVKTTPCAAFVISQGEGNFNSGTAFTSSFLSVPRVSTHANKPSVLCLRLPVYNVKYHCSWRRAQQQACAWCGGGSSAIKRLSCYPHQGTAARYCWGLCATTLARRAAINKCCVHCLI